MSLSLWPILQYQSLSLSLSLSYFVLYPDLHESIDVEKVCNTSARLCFISGREKDKDYVVQVQHSLSGKHQKVPVASHYPHVFDEN